MSKRTAGLWYTAQTGNHQGLIVSEKTGANVAVSYDAKDADLIAAAPELLESLKLLTDWMRTHTGPSDEMLDTLVDAMAAIGKAEGSL